MLESALVRKIMTQLESSVGGLWIKISAGPSQVSGLPDIMGCCKARFIGIEVKVPGKEKTLRPLQALWLLKINNAGGLGFMTTSVEEAVRKVRNFTEGG